MSSAASRSAPLRRSRVTIALAPVSAAVLLAACASTAPLDTASLTPAVDSRSTPETGSIGPGATGSERADGRTRTPSGGSAVAEAAAGSVPAPLVESRRLRRAGDRKAALAVLDKAAAASPNDAAIGAERGLLALELGQIDTARTLLKTASERAPGDWRLHSGYGAALAAAGRHPEAQQAFAKALALAPDNPAVLNNLALSYALDGRHAQAESLLRRAAEGRNSPAAARQNLALLVGLQGRSEESHRIAAGVLPTAEAGQNARYLQSLTARTQAASAPVAKPKADTPVASKARPATQALAADGSTPPANVYYRLGGPEAR